MTSTVLSLATSASSIVEATGLAAQFKSIVPSDLFIALGLGISDRHRHCRRLPENVSRRALQPVVYADADHAHPDHHARGYVH